MELTARRQAGNLGNQIYAIDLDVTNSLNQDHIWNDYNPPDIQVGACNIFCSCSRLSRTFTAACRWSSHIACTVHGPVQNQFVHEACALQLLAVLLGCSIKASIIYPGSLITGVIRSSRLWCKPSLHWALTISRFNTGAVFGSSAHQVEILTSRLLMICKWDPFIHRTKQHQKCWV